MSSSIRSTQSSGQPTRGAEMAHGYKRAFRAYASGVAVVTADDGNGPVALTLTSLTSISIEPPLIAFSLSEFSSATSVVLAARRLVVHLLDSRHIHIAKLGATSGVDRFADRSMWTRLPAGEPIYKGVDNWLRCEILNTMNAGGSTIVVAQVVEVNAEPVAGAKPLVYSNREWHELIEASHIPG